MPLVSKISPGKNPPEEINVIIEVPAGGAAVKYEMHKRSGAILVDRILHTPMRYPTNYGYMPHTLSEDGDPCDVMVVVDEPLVPGCVIRARPIGVLLMEDEAGGDEKILAVPDLKTDPTYKHVNSYEDLPELLLQRIQHFFEHYKDLESGKWVKVKGWEGPDKAKAMILDGLKRAKDAPEEE
ncbi:inorganic diphosphatase [Luteithermobacter gelatinilyticus]|uniref:inorganic diphosphatase n=1 Tax=Luteithermobacter gelatinilyticus TaxID=2582913 RepID=UPI001106003E|nr:inorganic diphosphatase [Luteithermobacter gelatinilyticus]